MGYSIIIFLFRRFKQESYYYENEKYFSAPPLGDLETGGKFCYLLSVLTTIYQRKQP